MQYEFPTFFVVLAGIFVLGYIVFKMEDSNRERARLVKLHKMTKERRKV